MNKQHIVTINLNDSCWNIVYVRENIRFLLFVREMLSIISLVIFCTSFSKQFKEAEFQCKKKLAKKKFRCFTFRERGRGKKPRHKNNGQSVCFQTRDKKKAYIHARA